MPVDPLMDLRDKLPVGRPRVASPARNPQGGPVPFAVKFAVSPIEMNKHDKTYFTVTVTEATEISSDGKVETISDRVQEERED